LFIYLEVIGMAYAYYATHSVPVTLPVLIAITGITRLIILQGKEAEPSKLLFEAGAVLLLAVSLAVLSWASQRTSSIDTVDQSGH
jgi:protein PsiE